MRYRGKLLGTFGRAGFYSLSTLKPVASFHGGLVVTDDEALAAALLRSARELPLPSRRWLFKMFARDAILHAASHPAPFSLASYYGVAALERVAPAIVDEFQRGNIIYDPARRAARATRKTRIAESFFAAYTDAQAALAEGCLDALEAGNRRRCELASRLHRALQAAAVPGLVALDPLGSPTFWRCPLGLQSRRAPRLPPAVRHRQRPHQPLLREPRARLRRARRRAPNAADFVDRMVFLPLRPNLDEADMDHLARAVIAFHAARGPGLPRASGA